MYAACCIATFELRRRDVRAGGVPFRVPAAGVVPWLALAVIIALLAKLQIAEWAAVLATVAGAVLVYAVARARRGAAVVETVANR
jgi:membrane associated rhomboid family serine protease